MYIRHQQFLATSNIFHSCSTYSSNYRPPGTVKPQPGPIGLELAPGSGSSCAFILVVSGGLWLLGSWVLGLVVVWLVGFGLRLRAHDWMLYLKEFFVLETFANGLSTTNQHNQAIHLTFRVVLSGFLDFLFLIVVSWHPGCISVFPSGFTLRVWGVGQRGKLCGCDLKWPNSVFRCF